MKTGGSINPNPHNNGARKGPLRKIVQRLDVGLGGIFGHDRYLLECGHEVWGTKGAIRSRCPKCKASTGELPKKGKK